MALVAIWIIFLPLQSSLAGPTALELHRSLGSPDVERFRLPDGLSLTAVYAGEETCRLALSWWAPQLSMGGKGKALPADAIENFLDRFAPVEARGDLIRGIVFNTEIGHETYEHVHIARSYNLDKTVSELEIQFLSTECRLLFSEKGTSGGSGRRQ